jgi:hypothetical protein
VRASCRRARGAQIVFEEDSMANRKRSTSRRRSSTEMHPMRSGKGRVKSRKRAIAIGGSKARKKAAKMPKKGASRRRKSS